MPRLEGENISEFGGFEIIYSDYTQDEALLRFVGQDRRAFHRPALKGKDVSMFQRQRTDAELVKFLKTGKRTP